MNNKLIKERFDSEVNFSRMPPAKRLLERPFRTITRMLFSKFYNYILGSSPLTLKTKTFWGDSMVVVLPDDASLFHWSFVPGEEERLTRFMIDNIKQDWMVYDIGANHGYYSCLLSRLVGEKGEVYAFEPTPSTIDILIKNTKKHTNIKVQGCAVWEEDTVLDFYDYGAGYRAYNSFETKETWKDTKNANKQLIKVKAIKIDGYVSGLVPSFIKIDVEGAEINALRGMSDLLKNCSPIVSIEFWVNNLWNNKNDEILVTMSSFGYTPYLLSDIGLSQYKNEKSGFKHDYTNIIFIKNENFNNNTKL